MARDGQLAQDRELQKMEKTNKNNPKETPKNLTLKDQLAETERQANKTSEQKLSSMDWSEWEYKLRKFFIGSREFTIPQRSYDLILQKYKKDIEKFHRDGTSFLQIGIWMEEKSNEFLGWQ
jgi:hypothetical protein